MTADWGGDGGDVGERDGGGEGFAGEGMDGREHEVGEEDGGDGGGVGEVAVEVGGEVDGAGLVEFAGSGADGPGGEGGVGLFEVVEFVEFGGEDFVAGVHEETEFVMEGVGLVPGDGEGGREGFGGGEAKGERLIGGEEGDGDGKIVEAGLEGGGEEDGVGGVGSLDEVGFEGGVGISVDISVLFKDHSAKVHQGIPFGFSCPAELLENIVDT